MRHPTFEYLLVAAVAAAVTYLLTLVARRAAILWKAVAKPRDRDIHAVATPRMGGVAVFAGFALALFLGQGAGTVLFGLGLAAVGYRGAFALAGAGVLALALWARQGMR